MNDKKTYGLFLGCLIPSSQIFVEKAARLIAKKLDFQFIDLKGATCCPDPEISRVVGYDAWIRIAARNLSLAEMAGYELCMICNGCYSTFTEAYEALEKDVKLRNEVNQDLALLGRRYDAKIGAKNFIEVLYSDIGLKKLEGALEKRFRGLKVAMQYGCRLYKETEKEYPRKFDEIIKTLGAEIVRYDAERLCCGVPSTYADPNFSTQQRARVKLEGLSEKKPDCIALVCPACYDMIEKAEFMFLEPEQFIPVLNLTELVALCLGFSPEDIGLDIHRISAYPVVEKLEEIV